MRDKNKNFVCDYCQGVEGNFYTDTGNHVACQQAAEKEAELLSLRAELADAKARAAAAEKGWHANEARIAKLELAIVNALNPGEPKALEILEAALRGAK